MFGFAMNRSARATLMAAGAAFVLAGCATLGLTPAFIVEQRLDRGLQRLAAGEHVLGYDELLAIATQYPEDELGQRALLALTAVELDPRNPRRRLWAAADLAALYLQNESTPGWSVPVGETLYLLAQELGATEERARRAEEVARDAEERARAAEARARAAAREAQAARQQAARPLPEFRGPSVPARVGAVASERDQLATRVRELERIVATQRQELERIRLTLAP